MNQLFIKAHQSKKGVLNAELLAYAISQAPQFPPKVDVMKPIAHFWHNALSVVLIIAEESPFPMWLSPVQGDTVWVKLDLEEPKAEILIKKAVLAENIRFEYEDEKKGLIPARRLLLHVREEVEILDTEEELTGWSRWDCIE